MMPDAGAAEPLPATVQTATPDDVDDLIPLYCGFMLHEAVQPPAEAELRRRLVRLLASETDEVLIARAPDGGALGYLQQRYFYSVWRPDRDAYIEDVFVVEEARGRRVGELLVVQALERARAHGGARICLDTNERNARARRLYERLGFENANPAWDNGRQIYYSRLI
jgi:ribosomal protein S18 acetylase RimI-like enzyme